MNISWLETDSLWMHWYFLLSRLPHCILLSNSQIHYVRNTPDKDISRALIDWTHIKIYVNKSTRLQINKLRRFCSWSLKVIWRKLKRWKPHGMIAFELITVCDFDKYRRIMNLWIWWTFHYENIFRHNFHMNFIEQKRNYFLMI